MTGRRGDADLPSGEDEASGDEGPRGAVDVTTPYDFALPPELVARYPADRRDDSRLLVVDPASAEIRDGGRFRRFGECLEAGDLLVLNDTRVFPARLRARRRSGGAVEIVLLGAKGSEVPALVKPLTRLKAGERLVVAEGIECVLGERLGDGTVMLGFGERDAGEVAEAHGEPPIPPYLGRRAEPIDRERYQAVFARENGSAAAPTASLHFTPALLEAIRRRGIATSTLTLHVGYGTFAPVRPGQEELHAETYRIPETLEAEMTRARAAGRRVVAVGTTVARALESWAATGTREGETRIFLKPGHRFRAFDALLTNFHLPGSSLLVLVHAFAGDLIFEAYRRAVAERYRFFSYGDAMFIASGAPGATVSRTGRRP